MACHWSTSPARRRGRHAGRFPCRRCGSPSWSPCRSLGAWWIEVGSRSLFVARMVGRSPFVARMVDRSHVSPKGETVRGDLYTYHRFATLETSPSSDQKRALTCDNATAEVSERRVTRLPAERGGLQGLGDLFGDLFCPISSSPVDLDPTSSRCRQAGPWITFGHTRVQSRASVFFRGTVPLPTDHERGLPRWRHRPSVRRLCPRDGSTFHNWPAYWAVAPPALSRSAARCPLTPFRTCAARGCPDVSCPPPRCASTCTGKRSLLDNVRPCSTVRPGAWRRWPLRPGLWLRRPDPVPAGVGLAGPGPNTPPPHVLAWRHEREAAAVTTSPERGLSYARRIHNRICSGQGAAQPCR